MMKGTPAVYLGRIVNKEKFCAFIYGANGEKKLVKSWDEFESCMQSGLWFATKQHVEEITVAAPPIATPKPKPKAKPKMEKPNKLDAMVFEVTGE
jgi:hypothetical protein